MSDKTDTSILLDIYERLGTIEAELRSVIKTTDDRHEGNEKLEERVQGLELFRAKIGGMLLVGSTLVSGVLFLLWEGLTYLIPWAKTLLTRGAE
jgi:hypothetical protein